MTAPLGSLAATATVGLKAGASATIVHTLVIGDRPGASVPELLGVFWRDFRWPVGDSVPSLAAGELYGLRFTGTVTLAANVRGGVDLHVNESFALGSFQPQLAASLQCLARIGLSQTLGATYELLVAGAAEGSTLVQLALGQSSETDASASLDVKGDWQVTGVPVTVWELLETTLQFDTSSIQHWLQFTADAADLDWATLAPKLESEFSPLAARLVRRYAGPVIDHALSSEEVGVLKQLAGESRDALAALGPEAQRLLRKWSGSLDQLQGELAALAQLATTVDAPSAAAALTALSQQRWDLLGDLLGDEPDVLVLAAAIGEKIKALTAPLENFLAGWQNQPAKKLVADLLAATDLTQLASALQIASNNEKLRALAANKLTDLATSLFGLALDQINVPAATIQQLGQAAQSLENVVQAIDARLHQAASGRLSLEAALELARSHTGESLLAVVFTPGSDAAQSTLFAEVLRGNFQPLIDTRLPAGVSVQHGCWKRTVDAKARLSIQALGWPAVGTSSLTQASQVEIGSDGTLFLTSDTTAGETQSGGRASFAETYAASLLVKSAATVARTAVTDPVATAATAAALAQMEVDAGVQYTDAATTVDELTAYLRFAQGLGFIADAETYASEIFAEFAGLGRVSVKYRSNYDATMLATFFNAAEPADLATSVRTIVRPLFIERYQVHRLRGARELAVDLYQQVRAIEPPLATGGG